MIKRYKKCISQIKKKDCHLFQLTKYKTQNELCLGNALQWWWISYCVRLSKSVFSELCTKPVCCWGQCLYLVSSTKTLWWVYVIDNSADRAITDSSLPLKCWVPDQDCYKPSPDPAVRVESPDLSLWQTTLKRKYIDRSLDFYHWIWLYLSRKLRWEIGERNSPTWCCVLI